MRTILFAIGLSAIPFTGINAQERSYDDLLITYVDGRYEDCLFKADRYMDKDATRRDPMPYLYASMCYYEMSKLDKYTSMEEYKNANRDALKYARKYRLKDKDLVHFADFMDYWEELNTSATEWGINFLESGNASKARLTFDRMTGYEPENPGPWLLQALCEEKSGMKRDAEESLATFRTTLTAAGDIENLRPDQQKTLRTALILYADQHADNGDRSSATEIIRLGAPFFLDNPEFKLAHDGLVGNKGS